MPNYRLKRQMIEAVDNQLRDNDPKAVKEAFDRLIQSGYDMKKAKEMIAAVLIEEMYYILKNQEHYNEERYVGKLALLPGYLLERSEGDEVEEIDDLYALDEIDDFDELDDIEYDDEDEDEEYTVNIPIRKEKAPGRNEACPCGSGKKYKKCCGK